MRRNRRLESIVAALVLGLCVAGEPLLAAAAVGGPAVAAPTHLRPVQSEKDCAVIGLAAFVCDAAIRAGDLQLIWDESDKRVTGRNVYRVDGGQHMLLGAAPGTARYYLVKKPSGGYANTCFAVEALIGGQTSADSAPYCYAPGATATTRSLKPSSMVTTVFRAWARNLTGGKLCSPAVIFNAADHDFGSAFTTFFPWLGNGKEMRAHLAHLVNGAPTVNGVYAGYEQVLWNGVKRGPCGDVESAQVQTYATLAFDLDAKTLAKHKLYSATLTLKPSQTVEFTSKKIILSRGRWCQTFIGVPNKGEPPTIPSAFYSPPYLYQFAKASAHGAVSINVIQIVSLWVTNGVNFGIGVGGATAPVDLSGFPSANGACLTKFSTPSLQVIYF